MTEIPLRDFANQHGQIEAANMLGMTQGGLSRALSNENRNIVVRIDNGKATAFELRKFPYKKAIYEGNK